MSSTRTNPGARLRLGALPMVAIGVLMLAGCGSGGGSGGGSGSDSAGSTATTVTIREAGGGQVLATSAGRTLYVSDQEHGKVLCASNACRAIWTPLTVSTGQQPTAPAQLEGDLGTVMGPDGSPQVALDGQPLYTFSFDRSAGQVNGDGQADSFDGTDFVWHVATPTGQSTTPSPTGKGGFGY